MKINDVSQSVLFEVTQGCAQRGIMQSSPNLKLNCYLQNIHLIHTQIISQYVNPPGNDKRTERYQGTIIQTQPLPQLTTILPLSPPSSHRSVTYSSNRFPYANSFHAACSNSMSKSSKDAERLVSRDDNQYAPLRRHYRSRSRKSRRSGWIISFAREINGIVEHHRCCLS